VKISAFYALNSHNQLSARYLRAQTIGEIDLVEAITNKNMISQMNLID